MVSIVLERESDRINGHTEGTEAEKETDKHTERHDREAKSRACMRQNDSS